MSSWRSKPIGWRGESHRHYLAAKGIKTKYYSLFNNAYVDEKGRQIYKNPDGQKIIYSKDAQELVKEGKMLSPDDVAYS